MSRVWRLANRDARLDGLLGANRGGMDGSRSGSSDLILADAFLGDRDLLVLTGCEGRGARSWWSSKGLLLLVDSTSKMPLLERFARARALRILED